MVSYDIKMTTEDTLELDTIIKDDSNATDPITRVENTDDGTNHISDLKGIQTKTSIFNPSKPGDYEIDINGQTLSIKVRGASSRIITDFEGSSLDSGWINYNNNTTTFTQNSTTVYSNSHSLKHNNGSFDRITNSNFNPNGYGYGYSAWVYPDGANYIRFMPIVEADKTYISLAGEGSNLEITVRIDSTENTSSVSMSSLETGKWYQFYLEPTQSSVYAEIRNKDGSVRASHTYNKSSSLNSNGVGFEGGNGTNYYDLVEEHTI